MKMNTALFYGIIVEQSDADVLTVFSERVFLMFVFMYPASCAVCMVSGTCFKGWYVLYVLVLGWEGMGHKHSLLSR